MPPAPHPEIGLLPLTDAMPEPVDVTWSFPAVDPGAWGGLTCSGLDAEGRFWPSLGCFLLQFDGRLVLIDAGIGLGPNPYLGGLRGALPDLLAADGLRPDQVDLVIFTHLHMDHIGWAMGPDGPMFPNARHVAPAKDLAHFAAGAPGMGDHHRIAYETCLAPLVADGRVEALADGAEIDGQIRYLATPGHTPGHQSVLIGAGRETIAITGDVFHCPAQVERPDWSHRADHDPDTARASRHDFLTAATEGGWLVAAGHFRPGLQLGRITGAAGALTFRPEPDAIQRPVRGATAAHPTSTEADT